MLIGFDIFWWFFILGYDDVGKVFLVWGFSLYSLESDKI